jgi:hypothetical protein
MLVTMRLLVFLVAVVLAGCVSEPVPAGLEKHDSAEEAWYGQAVEQLTALNRDAESFLQKGKLDEAAAVITKGQPLGSRLLSIPRPTLAAMEAASDLDDLYGRMLLRNRHYGWARMLFQKNLARWSNSRPQTPETVRRRKVAESGIAECDRGLAK